MFRKERKPRSWPDLVQDPRTQFMHGRLFGQVELAVALLSREAESDQAQTIARSLAWAAEYFVEEIQYVEKTSDTEAHRLASRMRAEEEKYGLAQAEAEEQ